MDPYEQYLADIEYENYLKKIEEENIANAMSRSGAARSQLGPDYDKSFSGNIVEGITEFPRTAVETGKGFYNTITNPASITAEGTARTMGSLASATAGAIPGATLGAQIGAFGGPLGALIGGAGGGLVGGGLGLLGFNVATDATSDAAIGAADAIRGAAGLPVEQSEKYLKPMEQYADDFAYDLGAGTPLAVLAGAAPAVRSSYRAGKIPFTKPRAELNVASRLDELRPGITAQEINDAMVSRIDDPLLANKSLGEILDDNALRTTERSIETTSSRAFQTSADKRAARASSQLKYLDDIEQSDLGAVDAQSAIDSGIQRKIDFAENRVMNAEKRVQDAIDTLPPKIDNVEAGTAIRDAAEKSYAGQKGRVTNEFSKVDDIKIDYDNVVKSADDAVKTYFRDLGAKPSGELQALLDDLNATVETSGLLDAKGEPITAATRRTVRDLQALRSKALQIADSGDRQSAAVASRIANAVKEAEDAAVARGDFTPEQKAALDEGRRLRFEQHELFESTKNPTKRVIAKEGVGSHDRMAESVIPSQYFRSGDKGVKEAIRNYKQTVGDTASDLEPLVRYAVDKFRDSGAVKPDGTIDVRAARRWMTQHSDALDELPDLKRLLSNTEQAQMFLNEKFGDLKRTQGEYQKGILKSVIEADPEKAVEVMLGGKHPAKNTIQTVSFLKRNAPDAVPGLRRAVIEHLERKGFISNEAGGPRAAILEGEQFAGKVRSATLTNEWDRIRPALERSQLFTKSQLKGFDYVYNDLKSGGTITAAKIPSDSGTAQNMSVIRSLGLWATDAFIAPRFSRAATTVAKGLKAIPRSRFEFLLQEALLDPRKARDLLSRASARSFTKSAVEIFGDDLRSALGPDFGLPQASFAAKTSARFAPLVTEKDKPKIPTQQSITAAKSFPTKEDLLRPPLNPGVGKSSRNAYGNE